MVMEEHWLGLLSLVGLLGLGHWFWGHGLGVCLR